MCQNHFVFACQFTHLLMDHKTDQPLCTAKHWIKEKIQVSTKSAKVPLQGLLKHRILRLLGVHLSQ